MLFQWIFIVLLARGRIEARSELKAGSTPKQSLADLSGAAAFKQSLEGLSGAAAFKQSLADLSGAAAFKQSLADLSGAAEEMVVIKTRCIIINKYNNIYI